jgi:hypothetical protein
MRRIQLRDLPKQLSRMIVEAGENNERVAIMNGGKRVAWLIGEYDIGTLLDWDRIEDRFDIEEIRKEKHNPRKLPWDKVKAELGL